MPVSKTSTLTTVLFFLQPQENTLIKIYPFFLKEDQFFNASRTEILDCHINVLLVGNSVILYSSCMYLAVLVLHIPHTFVAKSLFLESMLKKLPENPRNKGSSYDAFQCKLFVRVTSRILLPNYELFPL